MSQDSKNSGISFAEEVVHTVLKPTYKAQLLRGINGQAAYHKYAHVLKVCTHILAAATSFISAYNIYDSSITFKCILVALAVSLQLSHAVSAVCSNEENTLMLQNTNITHNILSSIKGGNADADAVEANNSNAADASAIVEVSVADANGSSEPPQADPHVDMQGGANNV